MCCSRYRGRLRAIKLFLWLHGSAEYINMGLWWLKGLRHNSCLKWIQAQTEARLDAVVATGIE